MTVNGKSHQKNQNQIFIFKFQNQKLNMDLPRSQVLSVAKSAITEKVNITPTAQEMLNTSTQIFISYLTAT